MNYYTNLTDCPICLQKLLTHEGPNRKVCCNDHFIIFGHSDKSNSFGFYEEKIRVLDYYASYFPIQNITYIHKPAVDRGLINVVNHNYVVIKYSGNQIFNPHLEEMIKNSLLLS